MKKVADILPGLLSDSSKVLKRSEIRELLKFTRQPGVISFAGGLPYPGLFPVDELKDITNTVLEREGPQALQYGPTEGDERLIEFIVNWMREDEKAEIDKENIMIVSGSQQALDLIGRIFIDPGDPIIVGLPSYVGALQAFNSYRANFIGVPVDKEGMNSDRVEEILKEYSKKEKNIKFIYVVPDFQNPAGVTMTLERREKLLDLCYEFETIIVEDSPYRELRFEGQSAPMIGAMDKRGYAFTLHTFSKIFSPGPRIGWIIANKAIMDKIIMAKQAADLCTSPFSQAVVYEFCRRGLLEPHIKKIVNAYRKKRDIMLQALEDYMPKDAGIDWTHPQGGLFLWITLPEHLDAEELFPRAVDKKVAYVMGSAFHFDGSGKNTLRLNFSYPSEEQIDEGIKRLADLFREVM
ncbi:MAG: PLP-dependent aminotransferase family protein [Candidatus Aminicenantes bacterium]|nr:MAG: PLP-dependent aminotransferase family protein [Candidatus Aminicenantes bacterium]